MILKRILGQPQMNIPPASETLLWQQPLLSLKILRHDQTEGNVHLSAKSDTLYGFRHLEKEILKQRVVSLHCGASATRKS